MVINEELALEPWRKAENVPKIGENMGFMVAEKSGILVIFSPNHLNTPCCGARSEKYSYNQGKI